MSTLNTYIDLKLKLHKEEVDMPIAQSEIQVTKGLSNKFCQVSGVKHYLKWELDIYFIPLLLFNFSNVI